MLWLISGTLLGILVVLCAIAAKLNKILECCHFAGDSIKESTGIITYWAGKNAHIELLLKEKNKEKETINLYTPERIEQWRKAKEARIKMAEQTVMPVADMVDLREKIYQEYLVYNRKGNNGQVRQWQEEEIKAKAKLELLDKILGVQP